MRTRLIVVALALGVGVLLADLNYNVIAASGNERVAMIDDCDPEADWGPGGCLLRNGSVSMAEFRALLVSPLSPTTVVGHPSWRMDPGYLLVEEGDKVKVRNDGGRNHTFTKVAQFGAGVPPLSMGLLPTPECPASALIGPGGRAEVSDGRPPAWRQPLHVLHPSVDACCHQGRAGAQGSRQGQALTTQGQARSSGAEQDSSPNPACRPPGPRSALHAGPRAVHAGPQALLTPNFPCGSRRTSSAPHSELPVRLAEPTLACGRSLFDNDPCLGSLPPRVLDGDDVCARSQRPAERVVATARPCRSTCRRRTTRACRDRLGRAAVASGTRIAASDR